MKCKRLNEVIELLQPAWQNEPELNLMQFLQKLAKESGFDGDLADLSDGERLAFLESIIGPEVNYPINGRAAVATRLDAYRLPNGNVSTTAVKIIASGKCRKTASS